MRHVKKGGKNVLIRNNYKLRGGRSKKYRCNNTCWFLILTHFFTSKIPYLAYSIYRGVSKFNFSLLRNRKFYRKCSPIENFFKTYKFKTESSTKIQLTKIFLNFMESNPSSYKNGGLMFSITVSIFWQFSDQPISVISVLKILFIEIQKSSFVHK